MKFTYTQSHTQLIILPTPRNTITKKAQEAEGETDLKE